MFNKIITEKKGKRNEQRDYLHSMAEIIEKLNVEEVVDALKYNIITRRNVLATAILYGKEEIV